MSGKVKGGPATFTVERDGKTDFTLRNVKRYELLHHNDGSATFTIWAEPPDPLAEARAMFRRFMATQNETGYSLELWRAFQLLAQEPDE